MRNVWSRSSLLMHAAKSHLHLTCMEEPGLLSLDHLDKPDRIRSKLVGGEAIACFHTLQAQGQRSARCTFLQTFVVAAGLRENCEETLSGVRGMAQFLGAPETPGTGSHIRITVERAQLDPFLHGSSIHSTWDPPDPPNIEQAPHCMNKRGLLQAASKSTRGNRIREARGMPWGSQYVIHLDVVWRCARRLSLESTKRPAIERGEGEPLNGTRRGTRRVCSCAHVFADVETRVLRCWCERCRRAPYGCHYALWCGW
jgi:hypothetical protein